MNKYGIYLISDSKYSDEKLESAIAGGVEYVQLRLKTVSSREFYERAINLKAVCQKYDAKFIINDRLDIALAVDSDGLHIGQSDLELSVCRRLFPNKIIGVSATNFEGAEMANQNGADYIGVGSMFPTNTKSDATPVSMATLELINQKLDLDVVCIGGITIDNVHELNNKCNGIAVCQEILAAENPHEIINKLRGNWQ